MKKTLLKSAIVAFTGVGLIAGSAWADLFDSSGLVSTDYNNLWNETEGTGTALLEFYIDDTATDILVGILELAIDSTIFENVSADDFNVINPSGWDTNLFATPGSDTLTTLSIGFSNPLSVTNDPLQITFNYDLVDNTAFSLFETWIIDYDLSGVDLAPQESSLARSSGSAAPVPEPATMLLLGSGLAGLAGVARRKKK